MAAEKQGLQGHPKLYTVDMVADKSVPVVRVVSEVSMRLLNPAFFRLALHVKKYNNKKTKIDAFHRHQHPVEAVDRDVAAEVKLESLGYQQELKRDISMFECFG